MHPCRRSPHDVGMCTLKYWLTKNGIAQNPVISDASRKTPGSLKFYLSLITRQSRLRSRLAFFPNLLSYLIDRPAMASSSGHLGAAVPYRIRLRTLDNRSVLMGGFLPPASTLQMLANEIVRLGHAEAGTFSIVFPSLATRPPATYDPTAFGKSLESCGLFAGHLTLALEKFVHLPVAVSTSELSAAASGQDLMWARHDDEDTRLALLMPIQREQSPNPKRAANWSPPPSLLRGVCPRGRIDAQKVSWSVLRICGSL